METFNIIYIIKISYFFKNAIIWLFSDTFGYLFQNLRDIKWDFFLFVDTSKPKWT